MRLVKSHLILFVAMLASSLACKAIQRFVVPSVPVTPGAPVDCTDDSCLDACLYRIHRVLAASPLEDVGGDYAGTEAQFNLVVYQVNGDQIESPENLWVPSDYKVYQEDAASHQRVWHYFMSLVPAEHRKWIVEYVIFTDGFSNTLAWIDQVEFDDNARWQLGIDVLDSDDPILLTYTIVHEMGHVLTLNADQIVHEEDEGYSPYQNTAVCPQFMSTEGCSTPESYINNFYQSFWVDTYEEWMETIYKADTASPDEFSELVRQFYSNHPNTFVSEYAPTNIKEDMAESFEEFVLQPRPLGNNTAHRKVLFFYDYPELVALRQQMIQNLCSYVQ